MRIRKHAKISKSLLLSSSSDSLLLKSHLICQLNQSPWDIITFPPPPPPPPSDSSPPPPPPQLDGNYNGNGSFAEYSLGAIESVGSMKLETEVEEIECKGKERDEKRIEANLCCKTDGKQWQCKRESQKRHTMCDCHLAQIKNYNTLARPSIAKSAAASNKPTRARKATTIAPSNPNEYYYYSGFGPRWGKKRDAGTSITHKREREAVEPIKTVPAVPRYSSSEIDDDDEDEDEEDEEKCGIGKKRRRKPIKARSLKDLCEGMG